MDFGGVPQKGAAGFDRVAPIVVVAFGSDSGRHVCMRPTGGRAAENPEDVGGVVLAREDVQIELRLPLLHRNRRKRRYYQRH